MKPRLCYTYCTLLLILLVSSGMLFILVASEASKPLGHQVHHHQEEHSPRVPTAEHEPHPEESSPEKKPSGDDPSAFQPPPSPLEVNVQSVRRTPSGVSEFGGGENAGSDPPGRDGVRKVRKKTQRTSRRKDMLTEKPAKPDEPPDLKEVIFLETVSKNAGVTDSGLQDIPGTPSMITLVDYQTSEMNIESKLEENIEATLKNITHQLGEPVAAADEVTGEPDEKQVDEVPAQPTLLDDKINDSGGGSAEDRVVEDVQNITTKESNLTEENPMPVFSEWAQKQMAEAEKKLGEHVNASEKKRSAKPPGHKMPPLKLRAKNYAAPDCGAKIIASNPEAQSTGSVLTSHKDEYLLNPCTSKIWFVVELCEPVQAERVELANFELFSSSPKDFSVAVSNRFPTRDWSNVGKFTAKDERDVQNFNLHPHLFGKFVRVEIHSHYNSEHYCPVSLFRVYGTSEFEAFETDNTPSLGDEGDDDEELLVAGGSTGKNVDGVDGNDRNILKSASDAVMNIVKKAAKVLGKTNENNSLSNDTEPSGGDQNETDTELSVVLHGLSQPQCRVHCFTLPYQPRCVSCSPELRDRVEQTMSCKHNLLTSLLAIDLISASFDESQHLLCANILGFCLDESVQQSSQNINRSVINLLPADTIAAFCNIRAYEKGLLKAVVTEKPPSAPTTAEHTTPTVTTEFPTKVVQEEPTLTTIPAAKPVTKDEPTTSRPATSSETDPETPPKDNVNIFNVPEEATPLEPPLSAGSEQRMEEPLIVPPPSEVAPDDDVHSSQEDLDDSLLLDHHDGGIPMITTTTTPTPGSPAAGQKVQPESVFLRLSNRIKALERNMSLSGQYLEELSRRYRKQVEELQQSHAKTLHEIEEQTRRMHESEATLREENERLRAEFVGFRDSILSWKNITIGLVGFAVVNIVMVCALVRSCGGGGSGARGESERDSIDRELAQVSASGKPIRERLLRRKSIDGVIGGSVQSVAGGTLRKKRPSEEALNISGTYENLLIDDGGGDSAKVERKKGRNKHRKVSAPAMTQSQLPQVNGKSKRAASVEPPAVKAVTKTELMRTESAPEPRKPSPEAVTSLDDTNRIDEIPFLEDNDEFIIPTASDLSYNEFVPDSTSEANKTGNGMLSSTSSIDSKSTKSGKGRRLSSPAFFKSSLLRSSRKSSGKKSTPSQNVSSASSNTSSSAGSSNVRISINVHSPSARAVEDDADSCQVDGSTTTNNNSSNGWEWYKLKKSSSQDKFTKRKSKSESPDADVVGNGSALKSSLSFHGGADGKSANGGSFRRLFRKVF
uniref:SUN domain-containing ossification factor n=1 Tax=Culex pipiens TaxID=7175 RepID=A0A8D8B1X6_CULPI